MKLSIILIMLTAFCAWQPSIAQELVNQNSLTAFSKESVREIQEVNALAFQPEGYEQVQYAKLPDSLNGFPPRQQEKKSKWSAERLRLDPILVFREHISFKKGNIFIGFTHTWVRMSAYFNYNQQQISEEEFRKQGNQRSGNPKLITSYYGHYEQISTVPQSSMELINADSALVFDTHQVYDFEGKPKSYGCMVVNLAKYDLGTVKVFYFYPLTEREVVLQEINKTWGVIRFKPDREFRHPDHSHVIPKRTEPELYFGKFSFLNNPEQEARERNAYAQKQVKNKALQVLMEGRKLVGTKDFDGARQKYLEALQVDSSLGSAYHELCMLAVFEKNEPEAWRNWEILTRMEPTNKEHNFTKAIIFNSFGQVDSAYNIFGDFVENYDTLRYEAFLERAFIKARQQDNLAATQNFEQAIKIFSVQGEHALKEETHRMFNINQLCWVEYAYANFLMKDTQFEKAQARLFELVKLEERNVKASQEGKSQSIYGKITIPNLAELNYLLALSYAGMKDDQNFKSYLRKARDMGKEIPENFKSILDSETN